MESETTFDRSKPQASRAKTNPRQGVKCLGNLWRHGGWENPCRLVDSMDSREGNGGAKAKATATYRVRLCTVLATCVNSDGSRHERHRYLATLSKVPSINLEWSMCLSVYNLFGNKTFSLSQSLNKQLIVITQSTPCMANMH